MLIWDSYTQLVLCDLGVNSDHRGHELHTSYLVAERARRNSYLDAYIGTELLSQPIFTAWLEDFEPV